MKTMMETQAVKEVNMVPKEIEFKYVVWHINLREFQEFVRSTFDVTRELHVSGYDEYFTNPSGAYLRHRHNAEHAFLTVKSRMSQLSLTERVEIDLHLGPHQVGNVRHFAAQLGFEPDFCVFKNCFIQWTADVSIVYYVVYNANTMDTMEFVVEIEANPECIDPHNAIRAAEMFLGTKFPEITPVKRHNLSMHEMFTTFVRE
jgi:adenylate cyclase class IV